MKLKQLAEIGLDYRIHNQEMFCSLAPPLPHPRFLLFSQSFVDLSTFA